MITAVSGLATAMVVFLVQGPDHLYWNFTSLVVYLAALILVSPRSTRSPHRWLWPIGAFGMAALWFAVCPWYGWADAPVVLQAAPVLVLGVVSIVWIGIDARLALALAACFLTMFAEEAARFPNSGILPSLVSSGALAAISVWLLWRQSAPRLATDA